MGWKRNTRISVPSSETPARTLVQEKYTFTSIRLMCDVETSTEPVQCCPPRVAFRRTFSFSCGSEMLHKSLHPHIFILKPKQKTRKIVNSGSGATRPLIRVLYVFNLGSV